MVTRRMYLIIAVTYMLITFALIVFSPPQLTTSLADEDNFFESLTAIAFLVAALVFFTTFLQVWKSGRYTWLRKLSYLGLSLLFFFGAGEEISWGQRIFDIKTPQSLARVNYQNEITLHNLSVFEERLNVSVGDLFNLFWLCFTVLIPLSAQFVPPLRTFYEKFMPLVPWEFGMVFVTNWALAKLGGMAFRAGLDVSYVVHDMVEAKESNYAVFFMIIAVYLYRIIRSKNESASKESGSSSLTV